MRRILAGSNARIPRLLGGPSSAIEWGRLIVVVAIVTFGLSPVIGFMASLSILTAGAFAAAFLGFGRPALGVLGVSLLCTLDSVDRHFLLTTGGLLRWNTFNYLLLVVMLFSAGFLWRVADVHSRLLKALIVILVVDLVFSPDAANGIQHLLGALSFFGLLVYFARAADDPDLWYMVGLVNGTVGAVGGLMFLLLKGSLPYINANVWALFPETAIFATCFAFRFAADRPGAQLALAVLASANAMWTFLSGSRGGILIASVGILYIIVTMKRVRHRVMYVALAASLSAVALNMFGSMEAFALHRLNKLLDEDASAASRTSGRSDLAVAGWYMFNRRPFGVGTGGFGPTWAKLGFIPDLSNFKRGEEFPAHSGWIKVLAENGWPGFLLMTGFVGSFAFYGLRRRTPGSASLGLLVTAALGASFLSTEFQGKTVWFVAAAATAQLHPAEMARCVASEVERYFGRPHRLVATPDNDRQIGPAPVLSDERLNGPSAVGDLTPAE